MFILVSHLRKCFLFPSNYLPWCEVSLGSELEPFNQRAVLFTNNEFCLNEKKVAKVLCTFLLLDVFATDLSSACKGFQSLSLFFFLSFLNLTTAQWHKSSCVAVNCLKGGDDWSVTGLTSISCRVCLPGWRWHKYAHVPARARTHSMRKKKLIFEEPKDKSLTAQPRPLIDLWVW